MHTYSLFNILAIWTILGLFWLSLSLLLSYVCVNLCLWHLNASLLRPRTLFVLGHPLPLILLHHIFSSMMRMPERPSQRTFLDEAFILECQVILVDFVDTDLPNVIHNWGWESLCDVPVTCPSVLKQEFYPNMHRLDSLVPLFHTHVWGTHIVITPELVSDVLRVYKVKFPDYLGCERLRTVSKDELKWLSVSAFLSGVFVSSLTVQALQKALGFLTWLWLLFFTLFLTITLSQSLVLDFCYSFLCILL